MAQSRTATRKPARGPAHEPDAALPDARNRLLGKRRLAPADVIDRIEVTVNHAESPLAWLARRGHLSPVQLIAGDRLRRDFMLAGQAPRVTMRWDAAPMARGARSAAGANNPTVSQIGAKQRFEAAATAAGPGLSDVLWRVVCVGDGLETTERALGWPARAGKLVLVLALDRLVAHYHL